MYKSLIIIVNNIYNKKFPEKNELNFSKNLQNSLKT